MPRPGSAVLGGLPLTTSDFRDFAHMVHKLLVDDVSAPVGRFVARVSSFVATTDRRLHPAASSVAADTAFASVTVVPPGWVTWALQMLLWSR